VAYNPHSTPALDDDLIQLVALQSLS